MSFPGEAGHLEGARPASTAIWAVVPMPSGGEAGRLRVDERAVRGPAQPDPGALDDPFVAGVEQGHDVLVGDHRPRQRAGPPGYRAAVFSRASAGPQPGDGLAGLDAVRPGGRARP